jgi:hypothetical protein
LAGHIPARLAAHSAGEVSALLRFGAEKKNIPAAKPIVEADAANPLAALLIYKYDVFNRVMVPTKLGS